MGRRSYLSQHEAAEQLPLVTDSATVTAVEAMDHNRTEEIERAVARRLRLHDRDQWVDEMHYGVEIDWDLARTFADERDLDDLATLIARYHRPFPALLRLRIEPDCEFEFAAGQYVTIEFHETPRPYSITNSPTEDGLELCIRRVPDGRFTPDLFEHVEEGDEVTVRGPNGDFVLNDPSERDIAFLATGTGVAPLRSMIEYLFDTDTYRYEGEPRHIWLFLGCGWEDDLPYRQRFRDLDETYETFHFVPCLTRESILSEWDGETEYVQHVFLKYLESVDTTLPDYLRSFYEQKPRRAIDARIDPADLDVYACGTNAMVQPLTDVAKTVGVPDQYVDAEGYG